MDKKVRKSINTNIAKKLTFYLAYTIFIVVGVWIFYWYWYERYPANEWHSRYDCRSHIGYIIASLRGYVRLHENKMPTDLYELFSEQYLDKLHFICPAQYNSAYKAGFFEEGCPLFVSSYRLLTPGKKLEEIPDGSVVVREFEGNHPNSVIGEYSFPAGYYVIIKDSNYFKADFVHSSSDDTNLATK
jgi:hypothetical protein